MKKKMTFALATALFAFTISALPHHAAADPTTPPLNISKLVDKTSPNLQGPAGTSSSTSYC